MAGAAAAAAIKDWESLEARRLFSAGGAKIDPVIEWNNVLIGALRADKTMPGPGWASRNAAIVHAAIFDAVNSIDGSYDPYLVELKANHSLPLDAAVAGAGWEVLSTLYPAQKANFDAALQTTLDRVHDGTKQDKAFALGVEVADDILAVRGNDHTSDVVPYTPGSDPGDWQPTAPDFTPAWGPGWGKVTPFMMDSDAQFRSDPPPAMNSADYTAAYNEVKSLGAKNSTTRTADQTQAGIFWGYDRQSTGTPPALYNQWIQVIADQTHNTTVQNARLFALANMAMADAGMAAWDVKFTYNFWRPITAIQNGDSDGNPNTVGDPTWQPLGAPGGGVVPNFTPPFPAYVSGHATFGAAVGEVLKDFYGTDKMKFTLHSDELPGVTRSFKSFSQAVEENGRSRIYLGIHWQFDNIEGQKLGREVGDFVFDNALQRDHGRGAHTQTGGDLNAIAHAAQFITLDESDSDSSSVMTLLDQKTDDLIA